MPYYEIGGNTLQEVEKALNKFNAKDLANDLRKRGARRIRKIIERLKNISARNWENHTHIVSQR